MFLSHKHPKSHIIFQAGNILCPMNIKMVLTKCSSAITYILYIEHLDEALSDQVRLLHFDIQLGLLTFEIWPKMEI